MLSVGFWSFFIFSYFFFNGWHQRVRAFCDPTHVFVRRLHCTTFHRVFNFLNALSSWKARWYSSQNTTNISKKILKYMTLTNLSQDLPSTYLFPESGWFNILTCILKRAGASGKTGNKYQSSLLTAEKSRMEFRIRMMREKRLLIRQVAAKTYSQRRVKLHGRDSLRRYMKLILWPIQNAVLKWK